MRGKTQDWFTSYLTNRTQYVKLGNVESSSLQIVCGVSQGSTLGQLLFLLYITDLANSSDVLSFRLLLMMLVLSMLLKHQKILRQL